MKITVQQLNELRILKVLNSMPYKKSGNSVVKKFGKVKRNNGVSTRLTPKSTKSESIGSI